MMEPLKDSRSHSSYKEEIDCLKRDLSEITTANTVIRYERDDALAEISRLKEEVTRLRQYEDAVTAAKDGVLVVWNLMDTNSTVIANDYWQNHLEEIDRLKAEMCEWMEKYNESRVEVEKYKSGVDTTGQILADGDMFLAEDVLHSFTVGQTVRVLIFKLEG